MNKLLTTLLGLGTFGTGFLGVIFPSYLAKLLGVKVESGSAFLVRAISTRDVIFGLNILQRREKPREAAAWVKALGLVVLTDGIARLFIILKPGSNKLIQAEAVQSAVVAGVCFFLGSKLSKQGENK